MSILEQIVWYLGIAGVAAVLARLLHNGLFRVYRRLFVYLSLDLLESLLSLLAQSHRNAYAVIYFVFQTSKVIVAALVVLELYRLALAGHPALAAFGRKVVAGVLVLAGLVAMTGLAMDYSATPSRYPILKGFRVFERTMDAWTAVFLLLISCFVVWFPVRMKRNVALYIGGFAAWTLARSSMLLFINLVPTESRHPFSLAILLVEFVCLMVWLFGFSPRGEDLTTVTGHRWNPGAMERLTGQLGSINSGLARLGRR